jgi:hypothetical protein
MRIVRDLGSPLYKRSEDRIAQIYTILTEKGAEEILPLSLLIEKRHLRLIHFKWVLIFLRS